MRRRLPLNRPKVVILPSQLKFKEKMPGFKLLRIILALLPFVAVTYVVWRTWRLLPLPVWGKAVAAALMVALVALMPVCMAPGKLDSLPLPLASAIYKVSLSWVFILIYLLMIFLVADLLGLLRVIPHSLRYSSWAGTLAVVGLLVVVFAAGNIHYHHKHREALSLTARRPLPRPLRIVMLSDVHLGYHIRRHEFARWVDRINAERPDLVLIAGDVIDRSVAPLLADGQTAEFRRIAAPVYACPGNHEYYAGISPSAHFFRLAGITLLRDSAVSVAGINIVGRDDRSNPRRRPLSALMQGVDASRYTIVLDHQPFRLDEAEACGADFELCGHTHHGQVWPISWITDAIYEDAYGPLTKGRTRYYVSSGIGIWGGKFRIFTRSEYVVATLS